MKINFIQNSAVYLIIFLLPLIFSSCSMCKTIMENNTWSLVYENDKLGNTINGNINQLIEAVNNGKEIRLLIISEDQEYLSNAEHVWVKNGIVYIQNSSHISAIFRGDRLFIADDAYHWIFTISSKGERNMSRWSLGEHTSRGSNSDRVAVKWFVR